MITALLKCAGALLYLALQDHDLTLNCTTAISHALPCSDQAMTGLAARYPAKPHTTRTCQVLPSPCRAIPDLE